MRKSTIRNGMRLLLAALILINLATFFHAGVADLFSLSASAEERFSTLGIFWAAAIGGYGVVVAVLGFVLPANYRDAGVRLAPVFVLLLCAVAMFFYFFVTSLNEPAGEERLKPGTTITI